MRSSRKEVALRGGTVAEEARVWGAVPHMPNSINRRQLGRVWGRGFMVAKYT